MNVDIRLSTDFPMHPKVIKLRRKLGAQGVFSLISLWCFAAKHKPSGVLDNMDEEEIAIAAIWPDDASTFVGTLVELRWLDVDTSHPKTYLLHNWIDHNGYAASAPDRSDKARFSRLARAFPAIYARLKSEGIEAVTAEEYRKLTAPTRTNEEQTVEQYEYESYNEPYNESSTERTSPLPLPIPSPNNKKDIVETEKPASTAALDYGAISRLFGDKCPSLPKPQKMTDARKAAARKLWAQNRDKYPTPDLFFSELFQKIEASEFLSGRNGKWGGCCFDWALNPKNALKVLEGNYSGAPQRQETPHLSGRVYVTAEEAEAMERVRREYEQQH